MSPWKLRALLRCCSCRIRAILFLITDDSQLPRSTACVILYASFSKLWRADSCKKLDQKAWFSFLQLQSFYISKYELIFNQSEMLSSWESSSWESSCRAWQILSRLRIQKFLKNTLSRYARNVFEIQLSWAATSRSQEGRARRRFQWRGRRLKSTPAERADLP